MAVGGPGSRSAAVRLLPTGRLGRVSAPASRTGKWSANANLGMIPRQAATTSRPTGRPWPCSAASRSWTDGLLGRSWDRRSAAGHRARHVGVRPGRSGQAFGAIWAVALGPGAGSRVELGPGAVRGRRGDAVLVGVDAATIRRSEPGWRAGLSSRQRWRRLGQAGGPRRRYLAGRSRAGRHDPPSEPGGGEPDTLGHGAADRADATAVQVRPMVPGEDVCLEVFGRRTSRRSDPLYADGDDRHRAARASTIPATPSRTAIDRRADPVRHARLGARASCGC